MNDKDRNYIKKDLKIVYILKIGGTERRKEFECRLLLKLNLYKFCIKEIVFKRCIPRVN